jgi:hypothetical protein
MTAQGNWNRVFDLSIQVPYDKALLKKLDHVLVLDETAYKQNGSGSSQDAFCSLSFSIQGQEKAEEVAKHYSIQPRYRVHPGYQLAVGFFPEWGKFIQGEEIKVTLRIKNVGNGPVAFQKGGRNRAPRDNQYSFLGIYQGKTVPDKGSSFHFGGLSYRAILKPGEVFEDEVDLTQWFAFEKTGPYQILGSYYMSFSDPADDFGRTIWEDYITAEFWIQVEKE